MKNWFKKKLEQTLAIIARCIIAKYNPSIIAITGSVGKTSTKEAIYAVIKTARRVRQAHGNFNTEFGVPLTIIGDWKATEGTFFWLKVILQGIKQIMWRVEYPEVLILEYGVQKPGDMDTLLRVATPSIAVMTAIGETPAHLEFFKSKEELAEEKAKLLHAVGAAGFIVRNSDDATVQKVSKNSMGHTVLFGMANNADVRIGDVTVLEDDAARPVGMTYRLKYGSASATVRCMDVIGAAHAYAGAGAASIGAIFGMHIQRIGDALSAEYRPPKHRMHISRGLGGSTIIDDTYNASPIAMEAAFEAVSGLSAKRKIAVLGDMLELGVYSSDAHETVIKNALKVFDVLVLLGPNMHGCGEIMQSKKIKKEMQLCATKKEAITYLRSLLKTGDLVLIKASRGIGLEQVVEAVSSSSLA